MGALLRAKKPLPGLIVSSPAARALATAELVQAEVPGAELRTDEGFYNAYGSELVSAVLQFPDEFDAVLVVGHNPGFEELVDELTDSYKTVLKTCSLAVVRLDVEKWADIELGSGKLIAVHHPRELSEAV
jgi:phosphohistidine phosphatase